MPLSGAWEGHGVLSVGVPAGSLLPGIRAHEKGPRGLCQPRQARGWARGKETKTTAISEGTVSSKALKGRRLCKGKGTARVNVLMSVDYFKPRGGKIHYK